MKKRTWVVGGSIGVGVLLILTMFPSVVGYETVKSMISKKVEKSLQTKINILGNAPTIKSIEMQSNIIKYYRDRNAINDWVPGDIIMTIILFIVITILFLSGHYGY